MFHKYRAINECLRLIQQRQRQGIELPFVESAFIHIKTLVLDDAVSVSPEDSSNRYNDFFDRLLKLVRTWNETSDPRAITEMEQLSREIIAALTPCTSGGFEQVVDGGVNVFVFGHVGSSG